MNSEIKIVKKPIVCRAFVGIIDSKRFELIVGSEIKEYKFNTILSAEVIHPKLNENTTDCDSVYEGFQVVRELKKNRSPYLYLYKRRPKDEMSIAVIPKNAEYVMSWTNYEIVANKIIVFSSKFKYILYKIFGNLSLNVNE